MRGPHNLWRLIRTGATFERTGAMRTALEAFNAPPALRLAARVLGWPFQWLGFEGDPTQPPILRALTALGPAYIKFGQLLSTRPDVVGPELAAQLAVLQDKLPPFSMAEARAAVEHELGQPLDAVFADFQPPVAAASLAQVHRATLRATGQTVAVKVLRPGIERAFLRDVDAFYFAAGMIELRLNIDNPTVSTASESFVRAAAAAAGWEGQAWARILRVPVTTLDALVARHGTPAFIKIDVEGFEAEALAGLTRPPPALSFEFTTIQRDVAAACIARCTSLGYRRFNAMLGESHALVHAGWLDGEEIAAWLEALPHAANSGDIYARLA